MLPTLEGKVSHIPLNNHSIVILLPLYLGSFSHFFPFSCFLLDTPSVVLPFFCLLLLSITYLAFFDLFHSCCYPSSQINLESLSFYDSKFKRRDEGDRRRRSGLPKIASKANEYGNIELLHFVLVSHLSRLSVWNVMLRPHKQRYLYIRLLDSSS